MNWLIAQARQQFIDIQLDQERKLGGIHEKFKFLYATSKAKFDGRDESGGDSCGGRSSRPLGFLPQEVMIPKSLDKDITMWRKLQEKVTKYSDGNIEVMKNTMDAMSKWTIPITEKAMEEHYMLLPSATPLNVLRQKKHLICSLGQ